MALNRLYCLLSALILLHYSSGAGAKIPALIIFGDSSVDSGNNDYLSTIAKSNFKPYGRDFKGGVATGRFSNGRLATDFLSQDFGLPQTIPAYLDPTATIENFASGVCFASAATGYDNATSDVLSVLPPWKQLEYFKEYQSKLKSLQGEAKAQETITESLYIISLGTNDFLENYYTSTTGRSSEYSVDKYEDYLVGISHDFIASIYNLGARKVNIAGVPPMGCLPLERSMNLLGSESCNEEHNKVAADFNSKLQSMMLPLSKELPEIKLVYSDLYTPFMDVIKDPSSHGFENAESGCCASGFFEMGYMCNGLNSFTCKDANKFVFWDAIHPTEKMNHFIADRLMNTTFYVFL
ncbi:GDSL esterase/lipase At2g04570-like [Curcuma longa]|uniref:GDSL esterase/lipase At2g04570-like n=1 Tax=Curcuma longa TaxID=136217 RepID=UPI003D9F1EA4